MSAPNQTTRSSTSASDDQWANQQHSGASPDSMRQDSSFRDLDRTCYQAATGHGNGSTGHGHTVQPTATFSTSYAVQRWQSETTKEQPFNNVAQVKVSQSTNVVGKTREGQQLPLAASMTAKKGSGDSS